MHRYVVSDAVKERVLRRKGKLVSHDTIDTARSALVVVDMQNYFVAKGFPLEVPLARAIVPNINRLSNAIRGAGGTVAWVQTTANGALKHWGNHHKSMTPERSATRLAGLDEAAEGFKLYSELEALPNDLRAKKQTYSAFMPGLSNLDAQLRSRGIETVLITGTVTNVCCETSARDAMLLDYNVVMVSDANAALTEEEHVATLNTFILFFGDVLGTDDVITRLVADTPRKTA
jgi:ureidoacrylate peracid hydrolase